MEKYTTHRKVAEILRLPSVFSATTPTTAEQLENLIDSKMDSIDNDIQDSFHLSKTRERRDLQSPYSYGTGRRIHLRRQNIIIPLDTSQGDSLKVWDGSTDSEYAGSKTEGRAKDFWIEDVTGILYLNEWFSYPQHRKVDITYRHNSGGRTTLSGAFVSDDLVLNVVSNTLNFPMQGWLRINDEEVKYNSLSGTTAFAITDRGAYNTTEADHSGGVVAFWIPKDIEEATTKMVAIDLLNAEDWSTGSTTTGNLPSGQSPIAEKINTWKRDVDRILGKYISTVTAVS